MGGVFGGMALQSGSRSRTLAMMSDTVSPLNGCLPVSISKSTHPNAQRSARRSQAFPRACSGDMYAAVPRITPSRVWATARVGDRDGSLAASPDSPPNTFARPKSSTFTVPSPVILMLAGFRSR